MGTFSIWHWLIVLAVVVLVFGTKKLRNLGSDLGSALKGFKDGMKESETENTSFQSTHVNDQIIEIEARKETSANTSKASKQTTEIENSASQPTGVNSQITDVEVKEKTQPKV